MPEHRYRKEFLVQVLDECLGKRFEELDKEGIFHQAMVREYPAQKGLIGSVVERCIFGYLPDSAQEADLLIEEYDGTPVKTELKTTGMLIQENPSPHYVAKEPMSITAVGIYDIGEQTFETSHFWGKLAHLLIIFYHYSATHSVKPFEYKEFPFVGYRFHSFNQEDELILRKDWETVRALCATIVSHHPGKRDKQWQNAVSAEYDAVHGQLRRVLSCIDLVPRVRPRFRLKQSMVSAIIADHFGYKLEQLPGKYLSVSDVDQKCRELTQKFSGWTLFRLLEYFHLSTDKKDLKAKNLAERVIVAMFGGTASSLSRIALFNKFGLIGKSITLNAKGGRTEDIKLFRANFSEISETEITDETGIPREKTFEDSILHTWFTDHELLCILFRETPEASGGNKDAYDLSSNIFIGFKRLVFSDEFIDHSVRRLWEDTREKIFTGTLVDVVQTRKDGTHVRLKDGSLSSAPNFLKSSQNVVFMRGSATDSSLKYKTECVNGVRMLPQFVWLKGSSVVAELEKTPEM